MRREQARRDNFTNQKRRTTVGASLSILQCGQPQSVDIAVGIDSKRPVVPYAELGLGGLAGEEIPAEGPGLCLDIDPADIVFRLHGMGEQADLDVQDAVLQRSHGQMLFGAGVGSFRGSGSICSPQQTMGTPALWIISTRLPQ